MKLSEFLECKHDIEPDTSMTIMRCDKCGVDANVIGYIESLEKENQQLKDIISAIEFHACLTGDCPHNDMRECYEELIKIPTIIEEMRKENTKEIK